MVTYPMAHAADHDGGWFDACPAACQTACVYRFGWRRARQLARRLAGVASADLRFGGWFDACPAACPTACVYRFGSRRDRRLAQRLARIASAYLRFGGWFEIGPAAGLAARFAATAHSTTASQVRSGKEYAHAGTSQGGRGSKPGATRPGRY